MLLNCGVGADSWESPGQQGDPTSPSSRKSVLNIHWKDWCWSWNSNTLATWCEELTCLKRPWCWERLQARGEGNNRGWDGWMASLTQWTWVWVNPGSWRSTRKPGMLQSKGSQRVRHNWADLNPFLGKLFKLLGWLFNWENISDHVLYILNMLGIFSSVVINLILSESLTLLNSLLLIHSL